MNIKVLSSKRGITLLQSGETIVIHSSFYGVVAEGTRTSEHYNNDCSIRSIYNLNVCNWCGYWDLNSIIKREVKKWELNSWNVNECIINLTIIKDEEMALRQNVRLNLEKY